jgi:hypothetical protein
VSPQPRSGVLPASARPRVVAASHFRDTSDPGSDPGLGEQLADFIQAYNTGNPYEWKETERFRLFSYEELLQRDEVSLDLIWRDEPLEDSTNLPAPRRPRPGDRRGP